MIGRHQIGIAQRDCLEARRKTIHWQPHHVDIEALRHGHQVALLDRALHHRHTLLLEIQNGLDAAVAGLVKL